MMHAIIGPKITPIPPRACLTSFYAFQGQQMAASGNMAEAVRFLTTALQETPRDEELYATRAAAYASLGNFEV